MIVLNNLEVLPKFHNPVVTLGSFDGLHIGHKALLHDLSQEAAQLNGDKIVITFTPHPREFLFPSPDFKVLTSLEEKIERLSLEFIDFLILIPFNQEFANYSPSFFFEKIIKNKIGTQVMIIGKDHSFGKNGSGNADLLVELAHNYHIKIVKTPEIAINGIDVHSSKIREFIYRGDFKSAFSFLGYHYYAQFVIKEHFNNQYIISLKNHHKQLPEHGSFPVMIQNQKAILTIDSSKIILDKITINEAVKEINVEFV